MNASSQKEKKSGGGRWGEVVCINGRVIGSVDRYCVCQEPHRVNTGSVPAIQVLSPWVQIPGCLTSQAGAGEQADSTKAIDWAGLAHWLHRGCVWAIMVFFCVW